MFKKIASLFLAVMYLAMCVNIVVYAADTHIEGPGILYKPMDSSYTSVNYTLRDEHGDIVDNSLVSWSVNPAEIVILENGEVLLSSDTQTGNYTVSACYGNTVFSKNITIVSGFYEDFSSKPEGYMTDANRIPTSSSVIGAKGDFVIDFDFKYATGENAVALYITTKDQVNDYSLPMHIRSNADKYLIRFLHYEGGITRANMDYVVQKNYGEWANVKVNIRCIPATDTDVEHLIYDVYVENELVFENLRPANTTSTPYDGFRTVSIRQSGFHVDNFKIHSGLPIDTSDVKYKYSGIVITGEDNIGTPRSDEAIYVPYNLTNMFGLSVSDDAEWSISPAADGISVSDSGMLCINKRTPEGIYILSAFIDGCEYTKEITLSIVNYNLVVSGDDSCKTDHTFNGERFVFEAKDQFGTPVKVSWELTGNSEGVTLSSISDNSCELYVLPDTVEGTYSIKAVADPSENMSLSEYIKNFDVVSASYTIYGPDSVKKPSSEFETHTYTLRSEIGNDVNTGLKWKCDTLPLIKNGIILVDGSAPDFADIYVTYNGKIYNKTISFSSTNGTAGEPFNGMLCYNAPETMSLLDGVTDMKLEAVLVSDILTDVYKDVEWSVVSLEGDISATPDNVYIEDSKLFVVGKILGKINIMGKMNNSTLSTDVISITLKEAFTSLNGSALTINGASKEEITVYHYMPAEGNFYAALLGTINIPVKKDVEISSGASSVNLNLDFSKTGMHKISIEKESGEANEYTVIVNGDKLFEQNDLATLLADPYLEEYLSAYSDFSDDVISDIVNMISALNASDISKLALISKNDMKVFPASVYLIDFLKGNKNSADALKKEFENNSIDTSWVDIYSKDSKYEKLNSIVYDKITSITSVEDVIVLTAVKMCNTTNSKEIKPYLALIGSNKYNNADTSGKNHIASKVCGKEYDSVDELADDISTITIPSSSGSAGGSSSGGGSKTQSGTIGSVTAVASGKTANSDTSLSKYIDLNDGHWAYEYIKYLSEKNVINGYADNSFAPENNVTRAEFLKILVSAFGVETSSGSVEFEDVNASEWFYSYVSGAAQKGLIKGDGKYFRPDEYISRQDAAVLICRFIEHSGIGVNVAETLYHDNAEIAEYALESVYALTNLGIIGGMPDGTFAPVLNTTRAEASKMIYMAMDKGGVR